MAKRLNICIISREFAPDTAWGGIATFSLDLAKMLQANGHTVTVISQSLREDYVVEHEGINVVKCRTEFPYLPAWHRSLSLFALRYSYIVYKKFRELHKETPFDIVDVPDHLAEGLFFSSRHVVPTVTRLHTPFSIIAYLGLNNYRKGLDFYFIRLLEKISLNGSDILYSPCNSLLNLCKKYLQVNVETKLFGYPLDTEMFSLGIRDKMEPVKVLFVGRLEDRKGISTIAEAFPAVVDAIPDIELTILGADTPNVSGWDSAKAYLIHRFEEAGCDHAVSFIDPVPLDQLEGFFHCHDILWVPSLYDNFPFVTLEGLATGKAVISSDAGGIAEALGHTGCLRIFPAGDASALAHETITLGKDKALIKAIGESARARVVKDYSYDNIYIETMRLYDKATSNFELRNSRS
ncbi:MAG: glycosyltransferase family 4 protein [Mariprofundaceae bacterium]